MSDYAPYVKALERAEQRAAKLEAALRSLKNSECWCEVGIGNPMMQGRHSAACEKIRELLEESK